MDLGKSDAVLFITGHDYRSKKKANVHFIMKELSLRTKVRCYSCGFSLLSLLKEDSRVSLWGEANRIDKIDGIECFLHRTLLHPFNMTFKFFNKISEYWFFLYSKNIPKEFRSWIMESSIIFIESGLSVIYVKQIIRLNPQARIIYLASDSVKTLNCAPYILESLDQALELFDGIRMPSKSLRNEFRNSDRAYFVPHGLDISPFDVITGSPFSSGVNLVSVGSMLFDPTFFEIASKLFPHYIFHIIGGGRKASKFFSKTVVVYDEMPYVDTLPFIKFASAGIAPYDQQFVSPYLADTSMKLMQFEALGIPAICPEIVVGGHLGRFGYSPGNKDSIESAVVNALSFGRFEGPKPLRWTEVVDRLIDPDKFPDTSIVA